MHIVLRTKDRALVSLTAEELLLITHGLGQATDQRDLGDAEFRRRFGGERAKVAALHGALLESSPERRQEIETAEVWAEPGRSVMLKAISVDGDPVELSTDEAREFAERLRAAIEASD